MSGIQWTEQDARDWLGVDIEHVNVPAVLAVLLAEIDELRGPGNLSGFVTPDLRALVQAEIDAVYEGDDYQVRLDPADVIADALMLAGFTLRRMGADCAAAGGAADDWTSKAIVLARLADWMEE